MSTSKKKPTASAPIEIGDEVVYTGEVRYRTPDAAEPYAALGGSAIVKDISEKSAHPFYLESVKGSDSAIFGWVDSKYVIKKEG